METPPFYMEPTGMCNKFTEGICQLTYLSLLYSIKINIVFFYLWESNQITWKFLKNMTLRNVYLKKACKRQTSYCTSKMWYDFQLENSPLETKWFKHIGCMDTFNIIMNELFIPPSDIVFYCYVLKASLIFSLCNYFITL